ncbi:MAG: hypothetical protein V2A78_05705 [bacterium]
MEIQKTAPAAPPGLSAMPQASGPSPERLELRGDTVQLGATPHTTPATTSQKRLDILREFIENSTGMAVDLATFLIGGAIGCATNQTVRAIRAEEQNGTDSLQTKMSESLAIARGFSHSITETAGDLISPPATLAGRLKMDKLSHAPEAEIGEALTLHPYQSLDSAFVKEIKNCGFQGKTLLCGGEDIEDQSVLVWEEKKGDGKILNFSCKLLEDADRKLLDALKKKEGVRFETGLAEVPSKSIRQGALHRDDASFSVPQGKTYTADLGDGFKLTYHPWEKDYSPDYPADDLTPLATQGSLSITCEGGPSKPRHLEQFLEKLKSLGVDSHLSTPKDLEMLYLRKCAWALQAETPELDSALKGAPSTEEKSRLLRSHIEKNIGVEDVTKVRDYDWRPHFETILSPSGKREGGWAHWLRFDAEPFLEEELADYRPALYLYGTQGQKTEAILSLLQNGGSFICSEERFNRMGSARQGISSIRDRNSGGASYVFAHLEKHPEETDVVFSRDLMKRADHMALNAGKFGHVDPNAEGRRTPLSSYHRSPVYEVMFKHSVSLLNSLEKVWMDSEAERQTLLIGFHDKGIDRIRGIAVEEIVSTRPSVPHLA